MAGRTLYAGRLHLRLLGLGLRGGLAVRLAARRRRDLYPPATTLYATLPTLGQRSGRNGLAVLFAPPLLKATLVKAAFFAPTLIPPLVKVALFESMFYVRAFFALVLQTSGLGGLASGGDGFEVEAFA